jgi:5-methylcytosine-specific restriction endonuclease McrA
MASVAEAAPVVRVLSYAERAKRFRASAAWRRARHDALAANAERHGGVARCDLCGASRADGVTLDVDHITPMVRDWSLRATPSNLQVLCRPCNFGKGARAARDWRQTAVSETVTAT